MNKNPEDDSSHDDKERKGSVEQNLRGKTLQVYLYMLKRRESIGVRELQKELGFSSPSVANYHVGKLVELDLVNQDEYGRYFVAQRVQVGILRAFVNVGGFNIPRLSFFAAFFTTLLITYLILSANSLNIFAVGFAAAGAVAFWFETFKVWKMSPLS